MKKEIVDLEEEAKVCEEKGDFRKIYNVYM